jgi:hypothetical protein
MTFTLYNESSNFVTASSDTDGVVKSTMYLGNFDPPFDPIFETTLIDTITTSEFSSKSNFDFEFPPYSTNFQGLAIDATKNFYILYNIGDDISVTSNTTISAQLYSFIGYGNSSQLALEWPLSGETRFDAAETLVAGLSLEEIDSIVPEGDSFGSKTTVPMLSFKIRSNHTSITVNAITLLNKVSAGGTVPYITEENGEEGIVNISIYIDSDGNEKFSSELDTQVANVDLGSTNAITGIPNQSDTVVVPLINSLGTQGILIDTYDSETLGYPDDNDEMFFVTYTFGNNIQGGINASGNTTFTSVARLGELFATASITVNGENVSTGLGLSGVSNIEAAYADPEAEVNLIVSNVSIVSIQNISPDTVYLGQLKVPMLTMELSSDESFASTSVTIVNSGLSFLTNNTGVSKVWIYRDKVPTASFDESIDEFINSTTLFSDRKTLVIDGIDIKQGENYYLLLYDIGQNDNDTTGDTISTKFIKAQINNIETDSDADLTLVLVGQTPLPTEPATVTVLRAFIDSIAITIDNPGDAANTTLDVTLAVSNNSGADVQIESVNPRVYLSSLAGKDISYEFNILSDDTIEYPLTIPDGNPSSFLFKVRHALQISEGSGILDASIHYTVPGYMTPTGSSILLSRYKSATNTYKSAVASPPLLSLITSYDDYFWVFPAYIASIQYEGSASLANFSQGMALKLGDSLHITFQNGGTYIDQSSLVVKLNGTALIRTSLNDNAVGTYYYNETTGVLSIKQIGSENGTIEIDASDGINALTPAVLTYEINRNVSLSNVLFYPNPYRMGLSPLILGYFTTQPCDVTLYLFDHNGVQIYTESQRSSTIGYHEFSIIATTNALAPGIYLCRVVAEDDNGNEVFKLAKLSIF